jgi:hypothetical protein
MVKVSLQGAYHELHDDMSGLTFEPNDVILVERLQRAVRIFELARDALRRATQIAAASIKAPPEEQDALFEAMAAELNLSDRLSKLIDIVSPVPTVKQP